ncbi:MAG: cupin domain-containing protein [Deltaproteobacteria bacterium]|nr:cupin domain-containing protein [Deltaproteobacteria bacterium]
MAVDLEKRKSEGGKRRSVYVRAIESDGYALLDQVRELRTQPRVIRISEKPWRGGPQSYSTGVIDPASNTIQSLHIHQELVAPGGITEKHGHQSEALFYILEGHGHDIHDGERIDWQAGDVVLIPGSCVHQHFNGDPHRPARAMAIKAKPLYLLLGLTLQYDVLGKPKEHSATSAGFQPEYWPSRYAREEAEAYARGNLTTHYYDERIARVKPTASNGNLLQGSKMLLRPEEMPWEDSAHGRLKHLLNERLGAASTAIDMYIQEIAPGSRSGKHVHTAEEAFFVIEGRGYDMHWDMELVLTDRYERRIPEQAKRFDWQAGDLVVIPSNVVHQHFNNDASARARILSIQCRTYKYLGYADVEQLEDAPK